jgi:hypothetical protein
LFIIAAVLISIKLKLPWISGFAATAVVSGLLYYCYQVKGLESVQVAFTSSAIGRAVIALAATAVATAILPI